MNTGLLGAVVFVVVFAGIILLHELGHFIVARLLHIEVEEFGVGFPPRLLRLWRGKGSILIGKERLVIPRNFELPFDPKTAIPRAVTATADSVRGRLVLRTIDFAATEDGQYRPDSLPQNDTVSKAAPVPPAEEYAKSLKDSPQPGAVHLSGILNEIVPGTEFTLNWVPLGGFNKIKGEDDPNTPGGMAAAKPWRRILVLLAGAAMNILTAVLVYTILFSQVGIPDNHAVALAMVNADSPAQAAGLKMYDIVLTAGGERITSTKQLVATINNNLDKPLPLTISRNGRVLDITVTPRSVHPADQGPTGIAVGNPLYPAKNWFETIPVSFVAAGSDIQNLLALPGRIIAGTVSPQEAQVGGPRSIWNLFQQSVARDVASRQTDSGSQSQVPTNYTLLVIISLTLTVGVVNLLPIPALDGWRIFTSLVEVVLRRPIPAKYQVAINSIGFMVLLILLGFFYIKDIISPIAFTLP